MKVVTVALVILLVVAGVLLVMAVNKSDETGDNNTPELAYNTVKELLDREKINVELEVVTEKATLIYEVL